MSFASVVVDARQYPPKGTWMKAVYRFVPCEKWGERDKGILVKFEKAVSEYVRG
jgi:hypothetical protein